MGKQITADQLPTGGSRGRPRSETADAAILTTTLSLLSEEGASATTMAAIARRAGVSTATLYRRYQNRTEVIIDALSRLGEYEAIPDTGALDTDLQAFLTRLRKKLTNPKGARILAALLDDAARDPEMARALSDHISTPARIDIAAMFDRAIARGSIAADIDKELLIDMAVGPLYLRSLEGVREIEPELPARLTKLVLAAVHYSPPTSPRITTASLRAETEPS